MYEQLGTFRDDYAPELIQPRQKDPKKPKPLSKRQIMKKVLHLSRTKKKLL